MNDSRNKFFFVVYLIVVYLLSAVTAMAQPSRTLPSALQSQYAFRHITTEDGLQNNEVKGLSFDKHGLLWIETQTGWDIYDGKQVKAVEAGIPLPRNARPSAKNIRRGKRLPLPAASLSGVANAILDAKDDGKGNLWIATDHQGVYIYDKANRQFANLLHSPSQSTSIAEDHVSCIAIGKDGTVALGHIKKGISIYTPAPFRITHFQSATWRNVSSVMEDRSGNLWIGADGYGLFDVTRRKRVETEGNIVVSLLEDRQGRIWVGTYKEGLICLQGDKVTRHYTTANSRLSDNSVYSLCQDRTGRIWIGTLWGGLQALNPENGQWHDYDKAGKSGSAVMDFSYDGNDELYAGTLWGLLRIDIRTGKMVRMLTNRVGKPFLHEDIQSVHKDKRGILWVAHGKGMTVWNTITDSLCYLTKSKGLCDDVIRSICEDGKGRIWVGTSNGCSVITMKGDRIASIDNYTKADGLLDDNISRHSIILLHDGNMVIGSYEGFSFVNLTGKRHPLEGMLPYEIGEEWTVWTSWQAMLIYALLLTSVLVTYFLMRRAKRKAIAAAIKKAEEVWAKNASGGQRAYVDITMSETKITSVDEQLVERAVKAVEENIANDFTVEDLSKAVGLTRGHLHKRLTAITGKTPGEFIRTIRMKRACRLLDESGMSVSEVAYAVGYSSPKVFTRNFKSEMGMTPTEYLNNRRK